MKSSTQNSRKTLKPAKEQPKSNSSSNPFKINSQPHINPHPDIDQDSISESMRSTPSTAQMISNFPDPSFQNPDSGAKRPGLVKVPTFEFLPSSPSPLPGKSPKNEVFLRKDCKSLTAVKTPNEAPLGETLKKAAENTRKTVRTNTKLNKPFHSHSNSLSSNFDIEKVSVKVSQKERTQQRLEKDPKFRQEDTEKWESSARTYGSFVKGRSSMHSNGSMSSFGLSEAQLEVLNDLTRSVKELNQRLIRSEEITFERLKENLALKTKIKSLENRIEVQEEGRLESEGINVSCSKGCLIY